MPTSGPQNGTGASSQSAFQFNTPWQVDLGATGAPQTQGDNISGVGGIAAWAQTFKASPWLLPVMLGLVIVGGLLLIPSRQRRGSRK